jgi:nucleoside-diphosphate-sugar epimerase
MPAERFLITGASGFIGGAVARALVSAGAEVHGVTASGRPGVSGVVMHRVDLLVAADTAALVRNLRPTHLVHAAWDVMHGAYWNAPNNLSWLAAGAQLLEVFLDLGGKRAVGVGTCAEYAWDQQHYVEYASSLMPGTPYGCCKLAMFQAFEAARLMGASTAWARLFFPYGPGDGTQRFIPQMLKALRAGQPFPTTAGTQVRDFIHTDDVAAGLAALACGDVGGAVNLGSGVGVPLRQVALHVAKVLGSDTALLRFGALPSRLGEPQAIIADITRLREEVGFVPRLDWRDGVARTALAA